MKHALTCAWIGAAAFWCLPARQAGAQERGPKHDGSALYESLREVIDRGARLYNDDSDAAGCYRLFEGALVSIRPFLDRKLQTEVDTGLVRATKLPSFVDKAFELREVLGRIRAHYQPAWIRLGGEEKALTIADDFLMAVLADPKIDFDRRGTLKVNVEGLKADLVSLISHATGGPYRHDAERLRSACLKMKISSEQYDRTVDHLRAVIAKHGAVPADAAQIVGALEALKKEIVTSSARKEKSGDAEGKTSVVQGTVTVDGKPLTEGMVTFHPAAGKAHAARIGMGSFTIANLPIGDYRITVKGGAALPSRYNAPETSPLMCRIASDRESLHLALKAR